jgi:hypothetical protein
MAKRKAFRPTGSSPLHALVSIPLGAFPAFDGGGDAPRAPVDVGGASIINAESAPKPGGKKKKKKPIKRSTATKKKRGKKAPAKKRRG